MDSNPDFLKSLKLYEDKKFAFIPLLVCSGSPKLPQDQVLGFFYVDIQNARDGKTPLFKQDFVVNVGRTDRDFRSYAAKQFVNGKDVHLIDDFFRDYGDNGTYYHHLDGRKKPWNHHYAQIPDLPNDANFQCAATVALQNCTKVGP